jgi:hypothetical protein
MTFSVRDKVQLHPETECRKCEREALGWREFSKGITHLKAINSPIRHALKVSDSLQYLD